MTNAAKSGPDPNRPATESAVISALRKGIDKRVSLLTTILSFI